MNRISERYRRIAREFAQRAVAELGDEIRAIVLYGSVARGRARGDSDTDLLIVARDPEAVRQKIVEIEEDTDARHGYTSFLVSSYVTLQELRRLVESGSPHAKEVLEEGIVLYDDGSVTELRHQVAAGR